MNSLVNLMSMAGVQRTLIIACGDYPFYKDLEANDNVFIYFLPDRMLHRYDHLQQGRIQHYIESGECTRIIFVGSVDQPMMDRIHHGDSLQGLRAALRFNLRRFMDNRDRSFLPASLRDQMLVEAHVVAQCNLLVNYYFIRERVEKRQLTVQGMVADPHEEDFRPIFNNGVVYNDIISMN